MWDAGNRHWVNVDNTWTFSRRSPRTCQKVQVLVCLCSSKSRRYCVRLCIWLLHLRAQCGVIFIWISSRRYFTAHALRLKLWLGALSIPGPFDALQLCVVEELATVFETRFNVGLDFAIILSSRVLSCILFDTVWGQVAELKMLILNEQRRWFHASRVKLSSVSVLSSCFFGVDVFDLNLRVQVGSVKQPIKRNSVGSGHVSHCWTSAFDDHFDHCFIIFQNVRLGAKARRFHVWGNVIDNG